MVKPFTFSNTVQPYECSNHWLSCQYPVTISSDSTLRSVWRVLSQRNDLRTAKHILTSTRNERESSRLSACPPAPTWCAKSSDGSSVDTHLGERQMISFDLLKLGLMTRDPMILWSLRGMVCAVTRQGCSPRAFSQRVKLNHQSKAADYRGSGFLPGGSAGNRYMCHVVPV